MKTHILTAMSREERVPQGPGESLFLESRGEDEGDGQGQAHCAKHIGNSSKRDRTGMLVAGTACILVLYTWRALKVFVRVLPGTWKKLARQNMTTWNRTVL